MQTNNCFVSEVSVV